MNTDIDEVLVETQDLINTLADSKKNLYDLVADKTKYYSLTEEPVEIITQIVMFDCESAFLSLKQEIFDFYSKRYAAELLMHLVEPELETIKEEMKLYSMKIALNYKIQENIRKMEEKVELYRGLLPKYS